MVALGNIAEEASHREREDLDSFETEQVTKDLSVSACYCFVIYNVHVVSLIPLLAHYFNWAFHLLSPWPMLCSQSKW